ncbi:MauE/DoxX family redox-associated membrane protein [Plantactinospora sp. KLBMP9567]|uniref:MauE/DoxX family redox-associated membrane protein n=1 Tax=Plantactinospora sp. KLBMP9567 TaxID=3085900 RepID=UPI00298110BE|nr:MauE/DoxX family redox-associated membrane protein [Plantactinospora sp. KLBMP9567]MDW5326952.1 MauE/DoxX family redox-associated membrane protein [Plantactinospora sp. KLBMP9567]
MYVAVACRALVFGVFLCSLISKLRGPVAYSSFVASAGELLGRPRRGVAAAAAGTVIAEAAVTVLVVIPATAPAGLALAAALLVAFSVAVVLAMRRGQRSPCRCFGASETPLGAPHVVRNMLLVVVCLVGFVATTATTDGSRHPAGVVVALTVAAAVLPFILRLDDLVALFRPTYHPGNTRRK